jgi:UDP-N-acetylglucosamine 2-epimerase
MLSFPAISLRQSMERPEAQDAGTIILTGFEPEIVLSSVRTVIEEHQTNKASHFEQSEKSINQTSNSIPTDYQITNTSWRVLERTSS